MASPSTTEAALKLEIERLTGAVTPLEEELRIYWHAQAPFSKPRLGTLALMALGIVQRTTTPAQLLHAVTPT